jgi:diguanylate cyclase (GGDEF)-like protein
METAADNKTTTHWTVRLNHRLRTASFAIVFFVIGTHFWDKGANPLAWIILTLQFLLYPHLMYWRSKHATDQAAAERRTMGIDVVLMGAWVAALHFPLWITFALCVSAMLNITISWGKKAILPGAAALFIGAVLSVLVFGFRIEAETSWMVTALCVAGLVVYLLVLGNTAYVVNKKLSTTRKRLTISEQTLQATNDTLQRQLSEIRELQAQLSEQVIRDPLTGLHNRRYLEAIAPRELARCKREAQCLSVLMIDLDHFKQINDTYGHQGGDEVLKSLAVMLQDGTRMTDVACRYGGEEFMLLMPNMPTDVGLQRAVQWCAEFAALEVQSGNASIRTTLSVGIATYPVHAQTMEDLIRCADLALYGAKREGRNRARVFERQMGESATMATNH